MACTKRQLVEAINSYAAGAEPANYGNNSAVYGNLMAIVTHEDTTSYACSIVDKDTGRIIVVSASVTVTLAKAITFDTKLGFIYVDGTDI
jgi:hypothetical protein